MSDDATLPAQLRLLAERRAPYTELLRAIVTEVVTTTMTPSAGPLLELGAGRGQLAEWVPRTTRERMISTDASRAAVRALVATQRGGDSGWGVAVARGEALPFATGSLAGAMGLCVFDAFADPTAVVAELARVLAPGAPFCHFLDMATLLEAPLAKVAASGLVPLPNVFGDPGDHEWPLDILLVEREALRAFLAFAAGQGHPFARTFRAHFAAFLDGEVGSDIDAPATAAAVDRFKALASDGRLRQLLGSTLVSIGELARRAGQPALALVPFHSGRYLRSVLETTFRAAGGFEIERSEILTRAEWVPAPAGSGSIRYQSLCLGHQRMLDVLPARMLTNVSRTPPATLGGVMKASTPLLREAGLFAFVARRVN